MLIYCVITLIVMLFPGLHLLLDTTISFFTMGNKHLFLIYPLNVFNFMKLSLCRFCFLDNIITFHIICVSVAYVQTTRALMITGSILGLPAVGMLLMSMPCINLGGESQSSKNKRAVLGGVLILIVGKTLNFTIHTEQLNLMDND